MLDTVRVAIPLNLSQHDRITKLAFRSDRELPAFLNPVTGELRFRRVDGLADTDQNSFHREIRWEVTPRYIEQQTYLTVELSLPKLWYGHNVELLYDYSDALNLLRVFLNQSLELRTCNALCPIEQWELKRLDCCYAWKFPSQMLAQQVLDSLKHLAYPRKQSHVRHTSIAFVGATYSFKFYLKHPEFRSHDLKALIKQKVPLEVVNSFEDKAKGVLRVEATLRQKYLDRIKVKTVSDILNFGTSNSDPSSGKRDFPVEVLQYFIRKFMGENVGMERPDEVKARLMQLYKPVKAGRLVSFWLYVQRFGDKDAKEVFGEDSYYASKRDLKKAGISLVEMPNKKNNVEQDFLDKFRVQVPSEYVVNKEDNYRDGDNILNLPRVVGED